MKKLVSIMLSLVLIFSFSGCGATNSTANKGTESPSATASEPTKSPANEPAEKTADEVYGQIENMVPTVPTKAPKELKVAVVMGNASMSGSSVPTAAIEDICKHFNWGIQTWNGEGDPSKQNEAIISAISWGADCIITASVQASNVQSALQAAHEAGVPCGSLSCGNDTPNPVIKADGYNYEFDVGPDYDGLGKAMGKWIAAHTEASGKVACWDFAGEYSIEYTKNGMYNYMKEKGINYDDRGCFTFDQLGDVLNRTVSTYLTNNPDTEFIYFPFDPAAQPVAEFLDLNGFTNVKVLGVLGNSEMLALIRQGSVAKATAAYDNTYMGYAAMDQMLRVLNGDSLIEPHGENVPYLVLDETNAPEGEAGWVAPFDYASSYYAIWQQ
jgi:ribose transport system substrate-binding protein